VPQQDAAGAFARPQMAGRLFPPDRLEINITLSRFNRLDRFSRIGACTLDTGTLEIRRGLYIYARHNGIAVSDPLHNP